MSTEDVSQSFDADYARTERYFGDEPEPVLLQHHHLVPAGGRILDLGAGQGRNALYLARAGYIVDALDPSAVAVQTITDLARREGMPINSIQGGFEDFIPNVPAYDGILILGLIPILTRPMLTVLRDKVTAWTQPGSLLFVTAFTTDDEAYSRHAREWTQIGAHSFLSDTRDLRTYLEPDEAPRLYPGFDVVHHHEGFGPDHRHGDGPVHRHCMVHAVFQRRA